MLSPLDKYGMHLYTCVCIYTCVYIYIFIHIDMELDLAAESGSKAWYGTAEAPRSIGLSNQS